MITLTTRTWWQPVLLIPVMLLVGCSSFRAIHGIPAIPANRLPPIYHVRPKADMVEISLGSLRQDPPEVYHLGPGDVLGVHIENVIGEMVVGAEGVERVPMVHYPEDPSKPPVVGHPIPVRENGTISLPFIDPFSVDGLTLLQVEELIRLRYAEKQILREGNDQITVNLIQPRVYRILVVREETGGAEGISKRGTGHIIDLPAGENDLLHALNTTGGLPGVDAENEIIIYRGQFKDAAERNRVLAQIESCKDPCTWCPPVIRDVNTTVVPLRFYPEDLPDLDQEDITLYTGDIVIIHSRDDEVYYTGGVLGGGEHPLPRDRDLDVLEAISQVGGQLGSGQIGIGRGSGQGGRSGGSGGTGVPPSEIIILRQTCRGSQIAIRIDLNEALMDPRQRILIQKNDVIILRYTFDEELINAALGLLQFNFLFNGFSGQGI